MKPIEIDPTKSIMEQIDLREVYLQVLVELAKGECEHRRILL